MEDNLILTANPCCEPIATCGCGEPITTCGCSEPTQCTCGEQEKINNTYLEFSKMAAVLQDSVLHSWKLHLKAKKHSVHVILEEYYDEAFDIIDGLIEHYQGICNCDIIRDDVVMDMIKNDDPLTYFKSLKCYIVEFVNNSTNFTENTIEIKSDFDDLLRLIDSTLYKLGNLTESYIKSFEEFIYENYK